jgi:hypothetical protein
MEHCVKVSGTVFRLPSATANIINLRAIFGNRNLALADASGVLHVPLDEDGNIAVVPGGNYNLVSLSTSTKHQREEEKPDSSANVSGNRKAQRDEKRPRLEGANQKPAAAAVEDYDDDDKPLANAFMNVPSAKPPTPVIDHERKKDHDHQKKHRDHQKTDQEEKCTGKEKKEKIASAPHPPKNLKEDLPSQGDKKKEKESKKSAPVAAPAVPEKGPARPVDSESDEEDKPLTISQRATEATNVQQKPTPLRTEQKPLGTPKQQSAAPPVAPKHGTSPPPAIIKPPPAVTPASKRGPARPQDSDSDSDIPAPPPKQVISQRKRQPTPSSSDSD